MIKAIIKELAIIILLIIAIGLIFFIVFYDYNAANTMIPKKVEAYELSAETRAELEETLKEKDKQELVKTYILDETDLRGYQSKNAYEKGKPNPFSTYEEKNNSETGTGNNTGENNNAGGNNTSGNTTSGNGTSGNNNSSSGDVGKFSNGVNGK